MKYKQIERNLFIIVRGFTFWELMAKILSFGLAGEEHLWFLRAFCFRRRRCESNWVCWMVSHNQAQHFWPWIVSDHIKIEFRLRNFSKIYIQTILIGPCQKLVLKSKNRSKFKEMIKDWVVSINFFSTITRYIYPWLSQTSKRLVSFWNNDQSLLLSLHIWKTKDHKVSRKQAQTVLNYMTQGLCFWKIQRHKVDSSDRTYERMTTWIWKVEIRSLPEV